MLVTRRILALICLFLVLGQLRSYAETQIIDAKIVSIDSSSFTLQTSSGNLAVEDDKKTRFWRTKVACTRESFKEGDLVVARIKTDADPPTLREVADKESWTWLENIRKQPQKATVVQLDTKYLTVKLAIGGEFQYRITEKSAIELKGKNPGVLSDITSGLEVYVKGRTLPTLDTWVVLLSDRPIPAKTTTIKNPKTGKSTKVPKLAPAGAFEAVVTKITPNITMIDVLESGRTLHVTYGSSTRFRLDGKPATYQDVRANARCKVTYRRDKMGRIWAQVFELITS